MDTNKLYEAGLQLHGHKCLAMPMEFRAGLATLEALDAGTIAGGRDVGTAAAFSRQIDLQELNFIYQGDRILDEQTGSQWDVFGRAVAGELAGARLDPVVSVNHFWFSWAAFKPETRINQP